MAQKSLMAVVGLAALSCLAAAPEIFAQPVVQASPPAPPPHVRQRIEVTPRPLLYRRCVDWYELQYRPSGTVLFPAKHCWWVRG